MSSARSQSPENVPPLDILDPINLSPTVAGVSSIDNTTPEEVPETVINDLHPSDISPTVAGVSSSERKRKGSPDECATNCKKPKKDSCISNHETCTICLQPWTTGGKHRLTSLKCGHLFCLSCISRWVEETHCCPLCKASAETSDIRNIFATSITAENTSERDRALMLLEEEKAARRQLEEKEEQWRQKLEMYSATNEALRTELMELRASAGQASVNLPDQKSGPSHKRYHKFIRIEMAQDAHCRLFDYSREIGNIFVSQKSPNALFKGYGIQMFSRDLNPLSFLPLHSMPIRDMCVRPASNGSQLLSCGLEKCIQLTSVTSKVAIQKFPVQGAVLCCAWNRVNTNLFYAGIENGTVREFDIRTSTHVQDVMDNCECPMSNVEFWNCGTDNVQGLLIAYKKSIMFKQQVNDQFITHAFAPLQAPITSLTLHNSGSYLTSYRPGAHLPKCTFEVFNLTQNAVDQTVTSIRQAVWEGGKMQVANSKNALISHPESNNGFLAVTANHFNNTVSVFDCSQNQELQTLRCYDKAIHIKAVAHTSGDLLGVLSEKDLILYKWSD